MAYALRFDGVNDYVTLGNIVGGDFADRLDVNQEWTLEWKFKRSGSDSYIHRFFDYDGGSADNVIFRASDGLFRISLIAGQLQWSVTGTTETEPTTFRVVKYGGVNEYELFVDYSDGSGFVSKGIKTTSVQIYNFNWIGQVGGTGFINGDMYYVDYQTTNSGVPFRVDKLALSGPNDQTWDDQDGSNDGTLINGPTDNSQWVFYDDGGGAVEQPELHEFSGSALVNASITASASKTASLSGNAQVSVLSQSSLSKLTEFSGQSTVNVSIVSLFEKVATFTGTATVDVTSQSDFSKRVAFSGESTVNVTASGALFDENFELHTFAGGVTISATASGQAIKVGLVSGESRVNATTTAQAQKVAALSGNAQVTASTQSAFSKLTSLAGNAISRITTAATITKQVLLNGASTVLARVSGTFFNTDSNVETYETTIQGRVKAPIVVQGTIKSLTIQGRVK